MNMQNNTHQPNGSSLPAVSTDDAAHSGLNDANNTVSASASSSDAAMGSHPSSSVSSPQVTPAQSTGKLSRLSPEIADDIDLIEKEWVNRAKMIVSKTKDDPHLQSNEINKYKADYIKKRYNKDVKVSEK